MERRLLPVSRDCAARLVPTGDPITVKGGTFVTLTQSLGGTHTIVVNGNMARIDGADADALGLPTFVLEFEPPATDAVSSEQVDQALQSVYDPEIPVNIVDLGLVYRTEISDDGTVNVDMTLTAPGCGMGPVLIEDVKQRVLQVPNVTQVNVVLVFDPPWSRDLMTEEAQLELGIF